MLRIFGRARHARTVAAEDRRQVGLAIFAGECVARRDQALTGQGQLLGRAQDAAEAGAVVEPVAPAEQKARCAGGDEAAPIDHASSLLSGGTRNRPVIIDPISLIGPASSTMTRCTTMNANSAAAQMKW